MTWDTESVHPPTDDPDPQWEAAKQGNIEAIKMELSSLATLLDEIDTITYALLRQIHGLRDGLEQHSPSDPKRDSVDNEFVSGGLRVPASVRSKRDSSTPPF